MTKNRWTRRQLLVRSAVGACVAGFLPASTTMAGDVRPATGVRALAEGASKKEDNGEKIDLDKVPPKVIDSVKKALPGVQITKAFPKAVDGKTVYVLDDVKVGKKGWDVTVAEDGTILKKEECHDAD